MLRIFLFFSAIAIFSVEALADTVSDCTRGDNADLQIQSCSELIRTQPNNPVPYYFRGHAFLIKEDLTRAALDFEKVISLDRSSAEPYFALGSVHFRRKQYREVIPNAERAISIGFDRSNKYRFMSDFDPAIPSFNVANLAISYEKLGQPDQAIVAFASAKLADPADVAWAHKQRARILEELGRNAEAITALRQALSLKPADSSKIREKLKILEGRKR